MAALRADGRRRLVAGSTLWAGVILAALLLGLVNYFGWKYYHRFDWTESDLYTLSEQSENVARSLERDVKVTVFTSPGAPLADAVTELLDRYQAESPRISVTVIDPLKNLVEAERQLQELGTRYQQGTVKVVFSADGERRIFEESDLADYDYSALQFGGEPKLEAFKGEELFTGTLKELASGERPRALMVTGHGEHRIDDALSGAKELLERSNVQIEEWASLGQSAVPAGTDLLVVAGPTSPFTPPELEVFSTYLEAGGRMLLLLDPNLAGDRLTDLGLTDWLAGYGVELGNDIVVDPDRAVPFYGAETYFVTDYGSHPVTRALAQADVAVILSLARSVSAAETPPAGFTVTELMRTSPQGWGETAIDRLTEGVAFDEGEDLAGPVSVAVAVERAADDEAEAADAADSDTEGGDEGEADAAESARLPPPLRMVVVGDSDFATDQQLANAGNAPLLDNAFNWLVERETFLGIPPKTPEQTRLSLTGDQLLRIYLLTALLPLLAIVGGVAVWLRRRR